LWFLFIVAVPDCGICQARVLDWVAIAFSKKPKYLH